MNVMSVDVPPMHKNKVYIIHHWMDILLIYPIHITT